MGVNPSWKTCRLLSILVSAAIVLLLFNVYLLVSLRLARDPSKSLLGGTLKNTKTWKGSNMRLAVVVPTHAGDLPETLKSLENWPNKCSLETMHYVDLVIYKAEGPDDATEKEALPRFRETAGKCFANTKIVYGDLSKEVSLSTVHHTFGRMHVLLYVRVTGISY